MTRVTDAAAITKTWNDNTGIISIVPKYHLSFIERFSIIFSHLWQLSGTAQRYALGSEWSGHQSVLSL